MYTQEVQEIALKEVADAVLKLKNNGYRMIAISCLKAGGVFEVIYSFDKEYEMQSLRLKIEDPATEICSVSGIYWNAFLYENEINDLFGLNIVGININYNGNLIQTAVKTPFSSEGAANK